MNAQVIITKADRGEGLTEEEIKVYREAVKPIKHTYGKYGTLAKKYLEEENVGKLWAIENLPEYLHNIDRQADELYEVMYARLSKDERYRRTGDFMEDYRRQAEMQRLIEEEVLSELVYVDQRRRCSMRAVLRIGKRLLKALFMGVVLIGTCIMNFIGAIICAIAGN